MMEANIKHHKGYKTIQKEIWIFINWELKYLGTIMRMLTGTLLLFAKIY